MNEYEHYSNILKALSDPNRLAIMSMLSNEELCACKILEALQISQPTPSHHMKYLTNAGLVDSRKREKWTYYTCRSDILRDLEKFLSNLHADKMPDEIRSDVKEYYGKELTSKDDLKTNACCCSGNIPGYVKETLPLIDDEVIDRFYGFGSPIPPLLEGKTVLDLGCGTGGGETCSLSRDSSGRTAALSEWT